MTTELTAIVAALVGAVLAAAGTLGGSWLTARNMMETVEQQVLASSDAERVRVRRELRRYRVDAMRELMDSLTRSAALIAHQGEVWRTLARDEEQGVIRELFSQKGDHYIPDEIHAFKHEVIEQVTGHARDGRATGNFYALAADVRATVPPDPVRAEWSRLVSHWIEPIQARPFGDTVPIDATDLKELGRYVADVQRVFDEYIVGDVLEMSALR